MCLAQEDEASVSENIQFYILQLFFALQVRKLRFRRPRPKLIDVENPDGDLTGSPVELNLAGKMNLIDIK